jgi:hypothetical protein
LRQARGEPTPAAALAARLRGRREEIEAAALTRIFAISDPPVAGDSEYAQGLREAVAAGIAFGIDVVERGEEAAGPVPAALLGQARLAAASGVSLDTVLRRYLAGHVLVGDILVEEAERLPALLPGELKALLRHLAAVVDRLLAAVSAAYRAYAEEEACRRRGAHGRRAALVERLLAGELLDARELAYDFGSRHVGLVASGPGAAEAARALAHSLDARLLLVERDGGALWAWLGRRRPLDTGVVRDRAAGCWPPEAILALGEEDGGPGGWRLTHLQARAAFAVGRRRGERIVRYADVALLASIVHDDLLSTSLRRLYLEPLEGERDGGAALRETLRAYFAAGRNGASAAKALGVSRQTVNQRLQAVEERIGRSLLAAGLELDTALRLVELEGTAAGGAA